MHKRTEYEGIRLWHKSTGSYDYYIEALQEQAANDNAPLDALYYDPDNEVWIRASDLKTDHWFNKEFGHVAKI